MAPKVDAAKASTTQVAAVKTTAVPATGNYGAPAPAPTTPKVEAANNAAPVANYGVPAPTAPQVDATSNAAPTYGTPTIVVPAVDSANNAVPCDPVTGEPLPSYNGSMDNSTMVAGGDNSTMTGSGGNSTTMPSLDDLKNLAGKAEAAFSGAESTFAAAGPLLVSAVALMFL